MFMSVLVEDVRFLLFLFPSVSVTPAEVMVKNKKKESVQVDMKQEQLSNKLSVCVLV